MEESLKILDIVVTFLAGGALIWAIKLISTLKSGIDAQKGIIDSLKAQTDFIGNIQDTVSKLYDPKEVENVVHIKVQDRISKISQSHEKIISGYQKNTEALYRIGSWVSVSMNDLEYQHFKKILEESGQDKGMLEFLDEMRSKYRLNPLQALAQLGNKT